MSLWGGGCPCDIWQPFFSRASASWGTSRGMIWQMQIHLGWSWCFIPGSYPQSFCDLLHCYTNVVEQIQIIWEVWQATLCVFLWFGWILESFLEVWAVTAGLVHGFCAFLLEKSFIRLSMFLLRLRRSRLQTIRVLSQNMFSIVNLKYDLFLYVYNDYIVTINLYLWWLL